MDGLTNGRPPKRSINLEKSSRRRLSRAATRSPPKDGLRDGFAGVEAGGFCVESSDIGFVFELFQYFSGSGGVEKPPESPKFRFNQLSRVFVRMPRAM